MAETRTPITRAMLAQDILDQAGRVERARDRAQGLLAAAEAFEDDDPDHANKKRLIEACREAALAAEAEAAAQSLGILARLSRLV